MENELMRLAGELGPALGAMVTQSLQDVALPTRGLIREAIYDWFYPKFSGVRKRRMEAKHEEQILKMELAAKEIEKYNELVECLVKIRPDNLQESPLYIIQPLAESAANKDENPLLREKYHNLLASSMDKSREMYAHPAFPSFLDQLSADDVKAFEYLHQKNHYPVLRARTHFGFGYDVALDHICLLGVEAKCDHPLAIPAYLQNLDRLGLVDITYEERLIAPDKSLPPGYYEVFKSKEFRPLFDDYQKTFGEKMQYKCGLARVTPLGTLFYKACNSDRQGFGLAAGGTFTTATSATASDAMFGVKKL